MRKYRVSEVWPFAYKELDINQPEWGLRETCAVVIDLAGLKSR